MTLRARGRRETFKVAYKLIRGSREPIIITCFDPSNLIIADASEVTNFIKHLAININSNCM